MIKKWIKNLLITMILGLSVSLSFGASKQVYYNGTTQQVIYYDTNPIEWPIHKSNRMAHT